MKMHEKRCCYSVNCVLMKSEKFLFECLNYLHTKYYFEIDVFHIFKIKNVGSILQISINDGHISKFKRHFILLSMCMIFFFLICIRLYSMFSIQGHQILMLYVFCHHILTLKGSIYVRCTGKPIYCVRHCNCTVSGSMFFFTL